MALIFKAGLYQLFLDFYKGMNMGGRNVQGGNLDELAGVKLDRT